MDETLEWFDMPTSKKVNMKDKKKAFSVPENAFF